MQAPGWLKLVPRDRRQWLGVSWVILGFVLAFGELLWTSHRWSGTRRFKHQLVQGQRIFGTSDVGQWTRGIESAQREIATLEMKFYNERESSSFLRQLSEKARAHRVSILTLRSHPSGHPAPSAVLDRSVAAVPIEMVLEGHYRQIGDCLKGLRDEQPVLLEIQQLDVGPSSSGSDLLRAQVVLLAYMSPSAPTGDRP